MPLRLPVVGSCLQPELPWGWWAAWRNRTLCRTTGNPYGKDESALLANMAYNKGKSYRKGIHSLV